MKPKKHLLLASAPLLVLALLLYALRPFRLIHGPIMYLVSQPLVWIVPTLAGGIAALVIIAFGARDRAARRERYKTVKAEFERQKARGGAYYYGYQPTMSDRFPAGSAAFAAFIVVGLIAWIPTALVSSQLLKKAIYDNYAFAEIETLPEGGEVRMLPKVIADQMVLQSANTSGYTTSSGHIILDPKTKRLVWTYEQAPSSAYNKLFRPTQGVIAVDAERTERSTRQLDRRFKVAPGMHISQNMRWRMLKRRYAIQPTDPIAVIGPSGEPVFVSPYLKWKGFPVRHPVLAGVMIAHSDGRIEDLSVKEARRRPEVAASGRLFPEKLARRVQDSYAYKNGILNTIVGHRDQTKINDLDGSGNAFPYLMAFTRNGHQELKWVSAAEPFGRTYATNAIFLTDAISGKTEVWRSAKHSALTGPGRTIQTARSLPGIVWTNFSVVEPRPVFIDGKLQYMLSVIPAAETANTVAKTVFVDAHRNKVVAVFHHDSDPGADDAVGVYLRTGKTDGGEQEMPAQTPAGADPLLAELEAALAAIAEQRADLNEQEKRLKRALDRARAQAAKP